MKVEGFCMMNKHLKPIDSVKKQRINKCAHDWCHSWLWELWRDTEKVASLWISVTSFALLSYFYGMRRNEEINYVSNYNVKDWK